MDNCIGSTAIKRRYGSTKTFWDNVDEREVGEDDDDDDENDEDDNDDEDDEEDNGEGNNLILILFLYFFAISFSYTYHLNGWVGLVAFFYNKSICVKPYTCKLNIYTFYYRISCTLTQNCSSDLCSI